MQPTIVHFGRPYKKDFHKRKRLKFSYITKEHVVLDIKPKNKRVYKSIKIRRPIPSGMDIIHMSLPQYIITTLHHPKPTS